MYGFKTSRRKKKEINTPTEGRKKGIKRAKEKHD